MAEPDMIAAAAAQIVQLTQQHSNASWSFRFTPATGLVEELDEHTQPPFTTVTGGVKELSGLLRRLDGWDGGIKIGVLEDQGLLDFWLY